MQIAYTFTLIRILSLFGNCHYPIFTCISLYMDFYRYIIYYWNTPLLNLLSSLGGCRSSGAWAWASELLEVAVKLLCIWWCNLQKPCGFYSHHSLEALLVTDSSGSPLVRACSKPLTWQELHHAVNKPITSEIFFFFFVRGYSRHWENTVAFGYESIAQNMLFFQKY